MFPVATLLVAVLLALLAQESGWAAFGTAPFLAALSPLFPLGWIAVERWWQLARRRRGGDGAPGRAAARVRRAAMLGWAWALFGSGWASWVGSSSIAGTFALDEVLLVLPLIAAWAVAWAGEVVVVRAAGQEIDARGHWAWRLRSHGFPAVPLLALALVVDGIRAAGWLPIFEAFSYASWAALAVGVVALFLASPWLARMLLPNEPLPPGLVRDIVATLEGGDTSFVRRVRVWKTGGRYVNAAIVGVGRRWQTILLSDALLKVLPPSEVAAVYAHERAHGTNRHPLLFLLLAVAFVVGFYPISEVLPPDPWVGGGVALGFAGLYWLGFFGWVSRRIEREADLDGAMTVGRADPMILALARIRAMVGGKEGWFATWRHFSTDRRIAALTGLVKDPSRREAARRTRRRLTGLALVLVIVASTGAAWRVPRDHLEGRMLLALAEERYDDFEAAARDAAERYPADPRLALLDALASARQGARDEAEAKLERLLALDPPASVAREVRAALRELDDSPRRAGPRRGSPAPVEEAPNRD